MNVKYEIFEEEKYNIIRMWGGDVLYLIPKVITSISKVRVYLTVGEKKYLVLVPLIRLRKSLSSENKEDINNIYKNTKVRKIIKGRSCVGVYLEEIEQEDFKKLLKGLINLLREIMKKEFVIEGLKIKRKS